MSKLLRLLVLTSLVLSVPAFASSQEDDPYGAIDLKSFNDIAPLQMTDIEDLDKNASRYIGLAAKDTVERKLGRAGTMITAVTGTIGQTLFGTETLTEGVLNLARKPMRIEGEYPTTVNGMLGQKAKAAVNHLVPYGTVITGATGFISKKTLGSDTLVEGILNIRK